MRMSQFLSCGLMGMLVLMVSPGCNDAKSTDSGPSPSGGDGAAVSGMERQAQDAVLAELQKHWVKGPEGWTTARVGGSPYAPDSYLRQSRELTVRRVEAFGLSESDRMNGLEWTGEVKFEKAPAREAGDPGIAFDGLLGASISRSRGRWTQWVDFQPDPVPVQKARGQWQVTQDTMLLRGAIPTAQDFAKAGVK